MSRNSEAAHPLAPLQEGLLFHTLSHPGEPTYFEQIRCTINGPLDLSAFEQAWNWVTARHSILRTAFAWENLSRPLQVVGRSVRVPFDWEDWRAVTDPEARWTQLLAEDRQRGFEMSRAPLMRLLLRQVGDHEHRFVWSHHHILLDGWSFGIVLHEVLACYASLVEHGRPISVAPVRPFGDYLRYLEQRDPEVDERFWREYLSGFSTPTRLAIDLGQGVHEGGSGTEKTISVEFGEGISAAVQRECSRLGVSLSALAHAAWARLLASYSGDDEVLFGSTTAGRPPELPGVEDMVGLFINAVPLRVRIDPEQRVGDWLVGVQRDLFRLQEHQYTGLARVQELSEVQRGRPLFETLLAFQNYPLDAGHTEPWAGIRLQDYGWTGPTNYPLAIRVFPGERIMLVLTYYEHRLDAELAATVLDQLRLLVEQLGTSTDRALWTFDAVSGVHADRQLREWNDTAQDLDVDRTLHGMVERHAATSPHRPAVVGRDGRLTYGELDERANQVAHRLVALGVRPGDRVGLCTEKSTATAVGVLGVMKAGAAYVPLDPTYPAARLFYMVDDAQLRAVVTWGSGNDIADGFGLPRLAIDLDAAQIDAAPRTPLPDPVSPEMFAYLIYTSGSSGLPKGVLLNHRGRVNNFEDYCRIGDMGPDDRTLCVSSLSFDISVSDMFTTFNAGGCLVFPDGGGEKDPDHWLDLFEREGITLWRSAPAVMDALLDAAAERDYRRSLRVVMLDGDWIPLNQPDRLRTAFPDVLIVSGGGATELSANSTVHLVDKVDPAWRSIPYGRPLANQTAYVLDGHQRLAPIGVPGELHLGGIGVGAGYWRRPELTAEKFVPHPWPTTPGERLYRTGDLARLGTDGTIELLGRIDFQVKIRGVRIELGEIEAAMRDHPAVDTCVVSAHGRDSDRMLVGYVVANSGAVDAAGSEDALGAELRAWLRQRLPEDRVPEAFVVLDRLPLSSNGKVNRRDLPAPKTHAEKAEPDGLPATDLERRLAGHWAGVLGITGDVDVTTSFFDMGGNSLKALRACRVPGLSVPITALYQYRSVRALAEHLGQEERDRDVLVRLSASDPEPVVICVPYGGGHAGVYQPLADAVGDRVALYAVRLPGHEHHEEDDQEPRPVVPVAEAVAEAAQAFAGRPLVVYGHCGGVALATEIARRLESSGADLRGLVVGASYPPAAGGYGADPFATTTDVELAERFAELGGFTELDEHEARTIGRLLRHDGTEARRYFAALDEDGAPPLRAPLRCLVGTSDPLTEDYATGWRNWGRFAVHTELVLVPGGDHYFIRGRRDDVAAQLFAVHEAGQEATA